MPTATPALLALLAVASTMAANVPPTGGATPTHGAHAAASTFCHGLDCPTWTVVKSTADYELRHYDATWWVATNGTAMKKDDINYQLFNRCFQYISGKNANNSKIAMTAPVLTRVDAGPGPNCKSTFTMHFMLPHKYWGAPIQPTDPMVYLEMTPAMDVYVKTFGGYADDADYQQTLVELDQALARDGIVAEEKTFYEAGYDGPYTFRNRHNEVWFSAKVMGPMVG